MLRDAPEGGGGVQGTAASEQPDRMQVDADGDAANGFIAVDNAAAAQRVTAAVAAAAEDGAAEAANGLLKALASDDDEPTAAASAPAPAPPRALAPAAAAPQPAVSPPAAPPPAAPPPVEASLPAAPPAAGPNAPPAAVPPPRAAPPPAATPTAICALYAHMGATSNAYECLQDLLKKLEAASDTTSAEAMLNVEEDAFSLLPEGRKDMLLVVARGRHLAVAPSVVSKWKDSVRAARWQRFLQNLAKTPWDDPKQATSMQPAIYLLK